MREIFIPEQLMEYVTVKEKIYDGERVVLKFENNYGASIINHEYSYGLELAVLYHNHICYYTEITDDVIPYLDQTKLEDILYRIKNLKEYK